MAPRRNCRPDADERRAAQISRLLTLRRQCLDLLNRDHRICPDRQRVASIYVSCVTSSLLIPQRPTA